jgi:hypothetical protein
MSIQNNGLDLEELEREIRLKQRLDLVICFILPPLLLLSAALLYVISSVASKIIILTIKYLVKVWN